MQQCLLQTQVYHLVIACLFILISQIQAKIFYFFSKNWILLIEANLRSTLWDYGNKNIPWPQSFVSIQVYVNFTNFTFLLSLYQVIPICFGTLFLIVTCLRVLQPSFDTNSVIYFYRIHPHPPRIIMTPLWHLRVMLSLNLNIAIVVILQYKILWISFCIILLYHRTTEIRPRSIYMYVSAWRDLIKRLYARQLNSTEFDHKI